MFCVLRIHIRVKNKLTPETSRSYKENRSGGNDDDDNGDSDDDAR